MRVYRIVVVAAGLSIATACRGSAPVAVATTGTDRTVFTDSATHARLCQPNKPGEDWRRVCTPLDQSVTPVQRLP